MRAPDWAGDNRLVPLSASPAAHPRPPRGAAVPRLRALTPEHVASPATLAEARCADGDRLTLHVGGGITWRSDAGAEWDETVAKARGPLGALGAREVDHGDRRC